MTRADFIKNFTGKVENDAQNIWVDVTEDIQANISIDEVMNGKPEMELFEASTILENDQDHPAWDSLYEDYLAQVEQ